MEATPLSYQVIEAAVHAGFAKDSIKLGYDPDERFYAIRSVSPATKTVMIGRDTFSNQDITDLLRDCNQYKVMRDPEQLYAKIMEKVEVWQQQSLATEGQLPELWRQVFIEEVRSHPARGEEIAYHQFPANLHTLSNRIEGLVENGIGHVFERLRLMVEVEGEDIEVVQRCPIHNFVKTKWLPAYITVRDRLAQERPDLIPSEKPQDPQIGLIPFAYNIKPR